MISHRRIVLSLFVIALVGLAATGAAGQTIMRGTFSLSQQTYWGSYFLPAGAYTLVLTSEINGMNTIYIRGKDLAVRMVAPTTAGETSQLTCLKADEINGTYIIRELDMGSAGRSFRFSMSKAARDTTLTGSVPQPVTVPVSTGADL